MSTFGFPQYEARRGVAHFNPGFAPQGAPPAALQPRYQYSRPNYAPPAAPMYSPPPREWQRRHDDASRLVRERMQVAALKAQLAAQQGTAAAQQQAAVAQAQLVAAQQQLAALQAQAASAQAQAQPGAVVSTQPPAAIMVPPSMPSPQPDVSPASPSADMTPTQDAAAAASAEPAEHPGHAIGRKVVIGLVLAGLAFGGYKFVKSRKKGASHTPPKPHGVHGFGRSRRRRGRR